MWGFDSFSALDSDLELDKSQRTCTAKSANQDWMEITTGVLQADKFKRFNLTENTLVAAKLIKIYNLKRH